MFKYNLKFDFSDLIKYFKYDRVFLSLQRKNKKITALTNYKKRSINTSFFVYYSI